MQTADYASLCLREVRNSISQVEQHVLAGGCKDHLEYAASLAKLRAYQSIEDFLIELNKRVGDED